jgi:toxin-antitoxin system PIN domain toxin
VLLPDVNVCLYAMRSDSPHHRPCKNWFESAINDTEPVGISELVLSSVLRLSTNHRVFREPSSVDDVLDFCDALLAGPATTRIRPGPRHWEIFTSLVRQHNARANDVPDMYLAALGLENGASLVTRDGHFARFESLRRLDPVGIG